MQYALCAALSTPAELAVTSFVALLRGVNVGGKNLVAMSDVSAAFEGAGHANVSTYGQSGNVLFEAEHAGGPALETQIEKMLEEPFALPIVVVIRSHAQLASTVAGAPANHGSNQLRSDVFFPEAPAHG